jgi:hypothetical protein
MSGFGSVKGAQKLSRLVEYLIENGTRSKVTNAVEVRSEVVRKKDKYS